MSQRIQRKRVKGWRLPENAVSVTRPGRYGNPFKVGHRYAPDDSFYRHYGHLLDDGLVTESNCLVAYEAWCRAVLSYDPEWLEPLRDKDLACFCPLTQPCHVDVLLKLLSEVKPVYWRSTPRRGYAGISA